MPHARVTRARCLQDFAKAKGSNRQQKLVPNVPRKANLKNWSLGTLVSQKLALSKGILSHCCCMGVFNEPQKCKWPSDGTRDRRIPMCLTVGEHDLGTPPPQRLASRGLPLPCLRCPSRVVCCASLVTPFTYPKRANEPLRPHVHTISPQKGSKSFPKSGLEPREAKAEPSLQLVGSREADR